MTQRITILGTAQPREEHKLDAWTTSPLPDPAVTGSCSVRVSLLCQPEAGVQRMDPLDMLTPETSFRRYVLICQACYDCRADEYVDITHGRGPVDL